MLKRKFFLAGLIAVGLCLAAYLVLAAPDQPTATVNGRITHLGSPVSNVKVVVVWESGYSEIKTGTDGMYSASGVPVGGSVFVTVRPAVTMSLEYRTWYSNTLAGDASKDFELSSGFLLTGQMVKPDGSPYIGQKPTLDALGSMLEDGEAYDYDLDPSGHFTSVLSADFYTLFFLRETTRNLYMPPTVIDLRHGGQTGLLISLLNRPVALPMEPPNASLIEVSGPNPEGYATIHGAAGSVPPLVAVMVDNLNSTNVAATGSDASGAFTTTLYAPPGSWLNVKYDPSGERVSMHWSFSKGTDKETAMDFHNLPGATLYVGNKPGGGEGWQDFDAVGKIGYWAGWWMSGTLETENSTAQAGAGLTVQAGEKFTVTARLLVTAPALNCTGVPTNTISGGGVLYYQFDESGRALQNNRWFTSLLFTPTGLPIEHEADKAAELLEPHVFTNLACITTHALEAHLVQSYTIPASLPDGVYQAGLFVYGDIPQKSGQPTLVTWLFSGEMASLPPLRVGNPATPHIPWTLLANYPINGLRGLQALEDVGSYAMPDRARYAPDLVVVPRLDERSGEQLVYRLEPGSLWLSGSDRRPPPPPYPALDLKSGELAIEVTKPGGGVDTLGPAKITQSWVVTPGLLDNNPLHEGTGNLTDMFHLYRHDETFAYAFQQYGVHTIHIYGTIEDLYGNIYPIEGTYELLVARVLDLDPAQLPTTPYEVGDVFASGLHVYPPCPADVEIRLKHLPDSDIGQAQTYIATGQANRFGYFQPPGPKFAFETPGEFRVDIQATYAAPDGSLWAGTTTWGSVVASPGARFAVHGRRGMDYKLPHIDTQMPTWFSNANLDPNWVGLENYYPFFSGDILWGSEAPDLPQGGESLHTILTLEDLTPGEEIYNIMRSFFPRATNAYRFPPTVVDTQGFEERLAINEAPLFISTRSGQEAVLDPEEVEFWGYFYGSSERPDVHVREIISEDGMGTAYWRYNDTYGMQIGEPADGDQAGDIKWNFGGAVFRVISETMPINEYNIYGSFWVLLPNDDPLGPRVTPPFQYAAGGMNGGPIMELLGEEIDMLFLPKGVRPGDILQLGDTISFSGHVGPTLDSRVEVTITSPSNVKHSGVWHANRIGWLYAPDFDFVAEEAGRWSVKVFVEHDRPYLPTGITPASHNTGSVLGTQGSYEFYVVEPGSPELHISDPQPGTITWTNWQIEPITIEGGAPLGTTAIYYTIYDKGVVMGQGTLTPNIDGTFSLTYDAKALHQDFNMVSLTAHEGRWDGLSDEVSIHFLAVGGEQMAAASVTLIGEKVYLISGEEPAYQLIYLPMVRR
jgi:hypothetical protein